MCHCNQCGYDWKPRRDTVGDPKACPRCKRYDWMKEKVGGDADRANQDGGESGAEVRQGRRSVGGGLKDRGRKVPSVRRQEVGGAAAVESRPDTAAGRDAEEVVAKVSKTF